MTAPRANTANSPFQPNRRTPYMTASTGRMTSVVRPVTKKTMFPRKATPNSTAPIATNHRRAIADADRNIEENGRAYGKLGTLNDVAFHQDAQHVNCPRRLQPVPGDHDASIRSNQERHARNQKSYQHPLALVRAAKLHDQQRHHQQLDEAVEPAEPCLPRHLRPRSCRAHRAGKAAPANRRRPSTTRASRRASSASARARAPRSRSEC